MKNIYEDLDHSKYLIDTLRRLRIISHDEWASLVEEILIRHLIGEKEEWKDWKTSRNNNDCK